MNKGYGLHKPQCRICLEDWPCEDVRHETQARIFAHKLRRSCHHCGQYISPGTHSEMFGGPALDGSGVVGPMFHTAKSRFPACAMAAKHYRAKYQAEMQRRRSA